MPLLFKLEPRHIPTPFLTLLPLASRKVIIKEAKTIQRNQLLTELDSLKVQSILLQCLRASLPGVELSAWSDHLSVIAPSISNFARKALVRCLPTNSNLHIWHRNISPACPHCGEVETENHVLSNCSVAATQGRYTWRYNAILRLLAEHIAPHIQAPSQLLVDLQGYDDPSTLYLDILPDITVVHEDVASILELTCCYEKNMLASKEYKLAKYSDPARSCRRDNLRFQVHTLEVSGLGFVAIAGLNLFLRSVAVPPLSTKQVRRMGEMALRCSFFIFCCRHRQWPITLSEPYFH